MFVFEICLSMCIAFMIIDIAKGTHEIKKEEK
jgi:hypothetical protein